RAPGIYQYRLLHLASNRSDLWLQLEGINYTLPDEEQSHGVAQILFLSQADIETFGKSELITKYVHKDEQNLCDRNVTMSSKQGNARTYIDRTGETTPNGESTIPSFMVCLQQTEAISVEEFRQFLLEQIVRPWSEQNGVMRLRLHLLEPYNESENSPCVSHAGSQVKNYQAWIELMLRDEAVAKQLFSFGNYAKFIKAIHTFPIVARYTMVYDSKPTIVGLRGYPAVQTIEQAGAENQKSPELLATLYGDVVRGWKN
ncbi:MAG TPA: hypothetical protein DEV81_14085, partial [Cyanobacteria bacterium UBA11049]|nr:hypothetical protein [Cyanobacteria bacterium UBA11049]